MAITGWASVVLVPTAMMQAAFLRSRMGLVMAPEPKVGGQTGHGGRMSEPGTVVDVVGAQHSPAQLLHNIIVFVGTLGGGYQCNLIGSVTLELIGNQIKSFIPGGFL